MHCNPILALLVIALIEEVDLDITVAEWFPSDYERWSFAFISPVTGVTRKRVDGTEVSEVGNDEVRLICCEVVVDRVLSLLLLSRHGDCSVKSVKPIWIIV